MTEDDHDKPKRPRLRVTEETPGKNEMYTVQRREVALHLKGASEADLQEFDALLHDSGPADMPFELRLGRSLAAIEAALDKDGFPPPRGWYLIRDGHWGAFPEDWNLAMAAEYGTMVEMIDPEAPHRIETGANYIKRRAEALLRPWWLGRLGELIIQILDEPDPDRRLTLTLLLGEERQRFNQQGHLAAVRRGADRSGYLRDNIEKRQKAAAPWQERAASMAAKEWACDPKLSTKSVAMIIYHEFKREADAVRADVTTQWPPIRNEEDEERRERDEERRERKIISELVFRSLLSANGKDIPSNPRIRNYLNPLHPRHRKES